VQDSEGNEENGYPDPESNKTNIKYTQWSPQEHAARRNPASNQWEFHTDDTRHGQLKHIRNTQDISNNKNKEYEKTQKQINEIIGALNKHQNETEYTINREINELKMNIENIKKWPMIWKTSEKRMKQKNKTKWEATPAE
jgi:hypothetical protein